MPKRRSYPNGFEMLSSQQTFVVATFGELFTKKDRKDGKRFLTDIAQEKKDLMTLSKLILAEVHVIRSL